MAMTVHSICSRLNYLIDIIKIVLIIYEIQSVKESDSDFGLVLKNFFSDGGETKPMKKERREGKPTRVRTVLNEKQLQTLRYVRSLDFVVVLPDLLIKIKTLKSNSHFSCKTHKHL